MHPWAVTVAALVLINMTLWPPSAVTTQFLAELHVYTTVLWYRNISPFLGCLENVDMVLEYIDGRTLYEVIRPRPTLTRAQKIDFHNQLLDGITHLHSFKLSHGDISLLNIQMTHSSDTIKLLDFGHSVFIDSIFVSPTDEPANPFQNLARNDLVLPLQRRWSRFTQPHDHLQLRR